MSRSDTRHQMLVDGARQDEQTRSWEAERSGDVALGITGSSMRRGKTSRRGAEHECVAERHQLFVDGAKRGKTSRCGAEQDSGAAFCARVQRLIEETRRADAALSTSA